MSSIGQNQTQTKKQKVDPQLPWWVELLFVQIGLPDKWLPRILKSRNSSIGYVKDNSKFIQILIILSLGIAYINPVTSYYRRQSSCFEHVVNSQMLLNESLNTLKSIKAEALNYCNGGNIY